MLPRRVRNTPITAPDLTALAARPVTRQVDALLAGARLKTRRRAAAADQSFGPRW